MAMKVHRILIRVLGEPLLIVRVPFDSMSAVTPQLPMVRAGLTISTNEIIASSNLAAWTKAAAKLERKLSIKGSVYREERPLTARCV